MAYTTRTVTSRVPPSTKPPTSAPLQRTTRRTTRPQLSELGKPKPIKTGKEGGSAGAEEGLSPEAALWAGADMDRSLEIRAADVEARMAELTHAEEAAGEQVDEHHDELHKANEREEQAKQPQAFKAWQRPPSQPKPQAAQQKPGAQQSQTAQSNKNLPQVGGQGASGTTSASYRSLAAVGQVKLTGQLAKAERPPDAFTLLKEAKDKGVLFVEDALKEGHSEEQEDPELNAAVEECIRQCFGLRGILRIGPGHNDKNEPIIVVATTNGFTDASFAKVPEKVHRFSTLIAIPFDLLPLKRER